MAGVFLLLAWAPAIQAAPAAATPPAVVTETAAAGVLDSEGPNASLSDEDEGDTLDPGSMGADYEKVEMAGEVEDSSDVKADAVIDHFREGVSFGQLGDLVELNMRPDHKPKLGADYVVFRGESEAGGQDGGRDAGMLFKNVGVVRITRVDRDGVEGRVVKQYWNLMSGDELRLREPQRQKYYALLKRQPTTQALKGEVVGVQPPALFAIQGEIVYLDLGISKGVVPGMRLEVLGDADPDAFQADDYDSKLPWRPLVNLQPETDDTGTVAPTGVIATVEVVNATASACAARVIHSADDVRMGDHVRTP